VSGAEYRTAAGRANFVQTDVADETSVPSAWVAGGGWLYFRVIHVLATNARRLCCAGIGRPARREWRQVLDVNVMGPRLVDKPQVVAAQ